MTGVFGREVRRKQTPLCNAICSSNFSVQTASLGYNTVLPTMARIMAKIFQRHLRRAVFADADADVRTDELDVGHAKFPRRESGRRRGVKNSRERGGERHLAARARNRWPRRRGFVRR